MKNISIKNSGYVLCRSEFYSVVDIIEGQRQYNISAGVNKLYGEIDSGIFALSYLISMCNYIDRTTLFQPLEARVDEKTVPLSELSSKAAYLDITNPLFASTLSIKELISKGIQSSQTILKPEDIKDVFCIDAKRFDRPLMLLGNERITAMAAIAFSYSKDIFCFPWLSAMRYETFKYRIEHILKVIENNNKIAIVPIGK